MNLRRDKAPEAMTRRAVAYLCIGAARHTLIGIFAIGYADQFANAAFIPIIEYAPLWVWGAFMLVAAALMLVAAIWRSAWIARLGLVVSATLTLAIGSGIALGVIEVWSTGGRATPISAILLLSLALKDYAVCTQPMRSPFEQVLRRIHTAARTHP